MLNITFMTQNPSILTVANLKDVRQTPAKIRQDPSILSKGFLYFDVFAFRIRMEGQGVLCFLLLLLGTFYFLGLGNL